MVMSFLKDLNNFRWYEFEMAKLSGFVPVAIPGSGPFEPLAAVLRQRPHPLSDAVRKAEEPTPSLRASSSGEKQNRSSVQLSLPGGVVVAPFAAVIPFRRGARRSPWAMVMAARAALTWARRG
jgi:hypothetical protein